MLVSALLFGRPDQADGLIGYGMGDEGAGQTQPGDAFANNANTYSHVGAKPERRIEAVCRILGQ